MLTGSKHFLVSAVILALARSSSEDISHSTEFKELGPHVVSNIACA